MKTLIFFLLFPMLAICQPKRDTLRIKTKGQSVIVITQTQVDSANGTGDTIPTLPVPTGPTTTKLTFSFTLADAATCGAGLYRNGRLIRTFFSNEYYTAGTHNKEYSPVDDNLDTITSLTGCRVEVTHSNTTYDWALAANTSTLNSGSTVHQGFRQIEGVAVTASKVYYNKEFSEGSIGQNYFNTNDIQTRYKIFPTEVGVGSQVTTDMCEDGTNVYWAGYDVFSNLPGKVLRNVSFVFANKISDNSETIFSGGYAYQSARSNGHLYRSTLNFSNDSLHPVSGITVQTSGNLLFVARTTKIDVLNKTTGDSITSNAITAGRLAAYGTSYVFVAQGTTVKKYSVSVGGVMMLSSTITGFSNVLALTINGDTLAVVDGGTSQLVKAYSAATGAAYWTFGTAGGYYKSSLAANNKFYFSDDSTSYGAGIDYASDGSFWLVDGGNFRVLHFNSARQYIEHIQYVPNAYNIQCDPNNPTRVFVNYLEFEVDYSKPLQSGNGSWTFKANWYNDPILLRNYNYTFTIRPIKLSNGRTYTLIPDNYGITYSDNRRFQVLELTGDSLRQTGVYIKPFSTGYLHWDGDLYFQPRMVIGKPMTYYKRRLTGFTSNNPTWGSDSTIASFNYHLKDPFFNGNQFTFRPGEKTTDRTMVVFEASGTYSGYHVGGLNYGDTAFKWRTARSTPITYTGQYPSDDAYDIGNNAQYPGGVAVAYGNNIIWGYHGEGWKSSQTNKFNHLYKNGLTIGQFGVVGPDLQGVAVAQMAGNVTSASIVQVGDTLYLWHNDEGHHSGISRWALKNLSSIGNDTVTPSLSLVSIDTTIYNLMEGLPYSTVLVDGVAGWHRTPLTDTTNANLIYTNYLSARTNLKSYSVFSYPDLYFQFTNKYYTSATFYKSFPATNQTTWSLSGKINYDGNYPSLDQIKSDTTGSGAVFLDVVDYNNKVLVRMYSKWDPTRTYIDYYANNQLLWRDSSFASNLISKYWQNYSVTNTAGTLAISYAGHSISGLTPLDGTANKSRPERIRIYMWSKAANYARRIGVKDLVFDK